MQVNVPDRRQAPGTVLKNKTTVQWKTFKLYTNKMKEFREKKKLTGSHWIPPDCKLLSE